MNRSTPHAAAIAAAVAGLVAVQHAHAASATWLGTTDGNWSDASNWSASPAPTSGDTATFNGAGNGFTTIAIDSGRSVRGVLFDTASVAGYTIGNAGANGGNTLTLTTGAGNKIGLTATVPSGLTQTINAPLSLTGAYVFENLGNNTSTARLVIAGNITNTALATINLQGNAGGIGNNLISGNITQGTGALGVTVASSANNIWELSGTNNYSGATVINFANSGSLTLSGSNAGTGTTLLSKGVLVLNSASNGGLASGDVTMTQGTIQTAGAARTISNNVILNGGSISFGGNQSLTINGKISGNSISSRAVTNNISGGTLTLSDADISNDTTTTRSLTLGGTGATTVNGVIANGNGTQANTLTVNATTAAAVVTLNGASTYTGGTTLTAAGGGLVLGNKQAFGTGNVAWNGVSTSATTALTGANAITNAYTLGGTNTFTGANGVELSGVGTLTATRTITNNLATSTSLTLSGATFNMGNTGASGSLIVNGSGNTIVSSNLVHNTTGTSAVTMSGTGRLTLSGTNAYTGSATASSGLLVFTNAAAIGGTGRSVTVTSPGTASVTYAMDQAFLDRVALGSTGVVALGADSANGLNFNSPGVFTSTAFSLGSIGNFTFSGALTPAGTTYRLGGGGGTLTVPTALVGGNALQVSGPGTVVLTGANSYTGVTNLIANSVLQGSDSTAYAGNATVTSVLGGSGLISPSTSGSTTLQLRANGQNDATAQTLTFVKAIQAATGGQTVNIDVARQGGSGTDKTIELKATSNTINAAVPAAGTTTLNVTGANGYRLMVSGTSALTLGGGGNSGALLLNPTSANLTINGLVTNSAALASVKELILDGTSNANLIVGAISNSSGNVSTTKLTKQNTSIWTLSGASTYTGATAITAGVLRVNGSLAAGSAVTVSGTGTLGGTGTINGPVTLNSGGHLAPGASPGLQTYAGGLAFDSGAVYDWEHDAANALGTAGSSYDQAVVSGGDVTIASGAKLNLFFGTGTSFSDAFWDVAHAWTIINNTGAGSASGTFAGLDLAIFVDSISAGTFNAITGEGSFDTTLSGTSVVLNWSPTVVPEPVGLTLLPLASAALLARRRRTPHAA